MKALLLPLVPADIEDEKDKNPQTPVTGAAVYTSTVLKALIECGSYDHYFVVRRSDPVTSPKSQNSLPRVCFTSVDALPRFSASDQVVLFAAQPAMHVLSPWRIGLGIPRAPITGIIHSMHSRLFFVLLMRLLIAGDMQNYDALICSSHAGKTVVENALGKISEQLEQLSRVKLKFAPRLPVVPLGVWSKQFHSTNREEARRLCGFRENEILFLYVGRFAELDKADFAPLILSFCLTVAPRCPGARLVLAGDDTVFSLTPGLRNLIAELPHGERVNIRPNISSGAKLNLFAAADVFISPSDNIQETFGITLIEAMAAQLPVLASDWNGYRDIVIPGSTGFLVPTYMNPAETEPASLLDTMFSFPGQIAAKTAVDMHQWAKHAIELAENADLRQRMGEQGRQRVQREYDWPVVIRKYEQLWDGLLEEADRVRRNSPSFCRLPFDEMSLESAFANYHSGNLGDQNIRLNKRMSPVLSNAEVRSRLLQPTKVFDETIFAAILSEVEKLESVNAEEFSAIVAQDLTLPIAQVRSHVARLAKFGFLEFVPNEKKNAELFEFDSVVESA
jgi:D-inositol-3-phosphate glycosyltransferase